MKRSVALDAVNGFFTSGAGNLGGNMKSRDLDIDYLFLLEALEGGVDPGPELVDTLEQMGLTADDDQVAEMLKLVKDQSIAKRGLIADDEFRAIADKVLSSVKNPA